MLAVSIELDIDFISMRLCVFMTRLNCAANTEILGEIEYVEVIFYTDLISSIG